MDRIMDPHGLFLMTNGSCYQVGEKLVLQMTRRSTGSAAFGAGVFPYRVFVFVFIKKVKVKL